MKVSYLIKKPVNLFSLSAPPVRNLRQKTRGFLNFSGGGGLERANQLTGFSMRVDDFMTFVQVQQSGSKK